MAKLIYKDYLPANARVLVDYKAKERVKFSYPVNRTYKKALEDIAAPAIGGWWYWLNLQVIMTSILVYFIFYTGKWLFVNGIHLSIMSSTSWLPGLSLSALNWIVFGLVVEGVMVPKLMMWWVRRNPEWLSLNYPKINAWLLKHISETKRVTFHSTDVRRKRVIIPMFENAVLDYKCYGDFGKQLTRIEIMEYPFNYFGKEGSLFWFLPWMYVWKDKNETLFRAVFHFDGVPTDGRLDVVFI